SSRQISTPLRDGSRTSITIRSNAAVRACSRAASASDTAATEYPSSRSRSVRDLRSSTSSSTTRIRSFAMLFRPRYVQRKAASPSGGALAAYTAALRFHHSLHDAQPHPGAPAIARALVKRLEDTRQIARPDARSFILHAHRDLCAGARAYLD